MGKWGRLRKGRAWVVFLATFFAAHVRAAPDPWAKEWWIARVASALSAGQKRLSVADIAALKPLSEDQIVDRFLDDPLFGEAVLRFNLHWLGQGRDDLRTSDGTWRQEILSSAPSAFASSMEVMNGGAGYFETLMGYRQPFYLRQLGNSYGAPLSDPDLSVRRKQDYDRLLAELQSLRDEAAAIAPRWPQDVCPRINALFPDRMSASPLFPLFLRVEIGFGGSWFGKRLSNCHLGFQPQAKPYPELVPELEVLRDHFSRLIERLEEFEPMRYKPKTLSDLQALELRDLDIDYRFFNRSLSADLPNSRTNLNRKRAAYVLRQFFCDDLTPISVAAPAQHAPDQHTTDQHASDPNCRACHYKLDPMAGFFKTLGEGFREFAGLPALTFDGGGGSLALESYAANWVAPAGAPQGKWNIGYVRSSEDYTKNIYGESMEDLFALLRSAPEVKRCFVRRAFQYFVSPQLLVDEGYIAELTQEFDDGATQNSTQAFRQLVRRLLESQAFHVRDPDSGQCYDHSAGYDPAGAPPCAIAYVVRQNCASCHKDTSHGVNFTVWGPLPDGSLGFQHVDESGQLLDRRASFRRILDRITSTDADERMPQNRAMPDVDRQTFYHWLEKNL